MIGKRYVDIHTALNVLLDSTNLGMDRNYSIHVLFFIFIFLFMVLFVPTVGAGVFCLLVCLGSRRSWIERPTHRWLTA